jgi:formylglycine-generating enzyme required for sulfatase activity
VQDADRDSLLIAIQISSDNGASWMVPLESDFFIKSETGVQTISFRVPGPYGDSCRVKMTASDSLPSNGTLRYIPAREHVFLMGSKSNTIRPEECPRHIVAFSRDFWMDTAEMNEAEFKPFKPDYVPQYLANYYYDSIKPVDNCYWHWAIQYCNWRSHKEGLDACYSDLPADTGDYWDYYKTQCDPLKNGYRLPSEAEWEYACRAGTMTDYYWGDDTTPAAINKYCWSYSNFYDTIHGPALLVPNRFGLYDMTGGMLELCNDWYDTSYYAHSPVLDPQGPSLPAYYVGNDPFRVTRGGHFQSTPRSLTSSTRIGNFSSARHPQSFRCVRTVLP